MSLTSFLNRADVRAKLKPLRPKLPRKIAAPLKVEPRSNRYWIVGTAFDYLLRFELQRRPPHAVARPWVAEYVPDLIWREGCGGGLDVLYGYLPQKEVQRRSRKIVEEAKAAVATYMTLKRPNWATQTDLAAHAIRLAYLDAVVRAGKLDPSFEVANPEDVEDLLALLAVVPFDVLIHDKSLLLNPTFGETSRLVGGADADLITGDMLVDFKTTKRDSMQPDDLDSLFGYYLLARHQRQIDPTFPEIKRLAFYFSRHGHLWIEHAKTWTDHPHFSEAEEWFFKRAKEVFANAVNM